MESAAPPGPWQRFRQAHLFDYNPASIRLWAALVLGGALAGGWALAELARLPAAQLLPVGAALLLVLAASWFPVQIPRTTYSVSVADTFVFVTLAWLGTPAAVLAAGADTAVGVWRNSRRLTSRLVTPSASMLALAVTGLAFDAARAGGTALWGGDADLASAAALLAVSLLPFVLTTLPLTAVITLKRGERLDLRAWWQAYTWVAALFMGAGLLASVVTLNMRQYGPGVLVLVATACLMLVLLLRSTLARQDRERQAQTERIEAAERQSRLNQQRFEAAFSHAAIGMAIVDAGGQVLQANEALAALLGEPAPAMVGRLFSERLHPADAGLFETRARAVLDRPDLAFTIELRCRRRDGDELWVALHCSPFSDPATGRHGLIYQLHDITSRHLAESRLQHIAYHDGLTDLANRHCFQERLALAVERNRTDAAASFAVMFLDLDRFKVVNDSLGHVAGNQLLREVADRIRENVRPSDLVARLGGDEFAILLESVDSLQLAGQLGERLLLALGRPLAINGTEIIPSTSIGITLSDMGYRSADEVLRDADLAMYEAKGAGRGRVVLFDSSMHERIADKLALEADLRHAIGDGQLTVMFQPLYWLDPYRPYGFEALARWVHPERGPVSPAVFIGLAEESGHIEALTRWVVDHSVAQLAAWQQQHPELADLGMHVNISGRDLAQPGLAEHVQAVLQRHGVAARHLTLEITETMLMTRIDVALAALNALRALGVRFSIDDFGTGYSSLAYLSTLPIDSLKIDRSFVIGLRERPQNVEIVRAVAQLGRSLGKTIIAEGIETPEQMAELRRLGIDVGQGYLMSRPLRADDVPPALLAAVVH